MFYRSVTCWTQCVKHCNDLGAGGRKNSRHIAANVRCLLLGYTGMTRRCLSMRKSGIGKVLDCLEMRLGRPIGSGRTTVLTTRLGHELSVSMFRCGKLS